MRRVCTILVLLVGANASTFAAPPTGYKIRIVDNRGYTGTGIGMRYITLNNRGNLAYQYGRATFWSEQTGVVVVPSAPVSGSTYFSNQAFNDNDVLGGMLYQGDGFTGPMGLGYTWSPTEGHKLYRKYNLQGTEEHSIVTAVASDGTPIGGYAQSTSNSGQSGTWNLSTGLWSSFTVGGQARVNKNGWVGVNSRAKNLISNQTGTFGSASDPDYVFSISDANLVYTTKTINSEGDKRNRVYTTSGQLLYSENTLYANNYLIMDAIARDQMALKVADFPTGSGLDTTYLWNHLTGGIALSSLANDSSLSQFTEFRLTSLNESYQIAGSARALNGSWYVVLLDPVPEPASILVLTAGLAGLLRRRKTQ